MIIKRLKHNSNGFTLVELLVVTVIMGLVIISMLGLFTNTQQNANTQEEVANTQQNLRVAMGFMVRDIQMAGFLVPASLTAVGNSPASLPVVDPADPFDPTTVLTLRTASTSQDVARLVSSTTVANSPTTDYTFSIATGEMVDLFAVGDSVRLIRSPDHNQTMNTLFTVAGRSPSTPSITLNGFDAPAVYTSADLLVKTSAGHPAQIDYRLVANLDAPTIFNSNLLQRDDGNGFETVAENIASVDLVCNPTAADARTIRVTITGTAFDLTDKQTKNRQITRLVSLKNNQ